MNVAGAGFQAGRIFRLERRGDWAVVLCGSAPIAKAPVERGEDLLRNMIVAEAAAMIDETFDRRRVRWTELSGPITRRIEQALRCVS
jgi:hypothetical protein